MVRSRLAQSTITTKIWADDPVTGKRHDLNHEEEYIAQIIAGHMGSVGDCYDNAMMESAWGTMQLELLDTRIWETREELANAIDPSSLRCHHAATGLSWLYPARRVLPAGQ